ncbi:unnamed protein product [Gordionus sp. m RMFG-2023]
MLSKKDIIYLYQHLEKSQILTNEYAHSLASQAYLHMRNIPFMLKMKENVEFMTEQGEVPLLRYNENMIITGFEHIVKFVNSKYLENDLKLCDINYEKLAFMKYIDHTFTLAEIYILWKDEDVYSRFTALRYGFPYSFPLNKIMTYSKKRSLFKYLKAHDWFDLNLKQVLTHVKTCCDRLSLRLGANSFIFDNRPTEIDALIYGHIYAILTLSPPMLYQKHNEGSYEHHSIFDSFQFNSRTNGKYNSTKTSSIDSDQIYMPEHLRNIVLSYENLLKLCFRIYQTYFEKFKINDKKNSDNFYQ